VKRVRKKDLQFVLDRLEQLRDNNQSIRNTIGDIKQLAAANDFCMFTAMFDYAKTIKPSVASKNDVYFVQAASSRLIKIGRAEDVSRRVIALQVSSPEELVLLGWVEESKFTEADLHKRFEKYRRRGEWFSPAKDILNFIQEHCRRPANL
jgi:hypothetical protein